MITLIICLAVITGLFWLGFTITGAFLKAFVWLLLILPITLIIWNLGLVCCCTIILIPLGVWLFKAGGSFMNVL